MVYVVVFVLKHQKTKSMKKEKKRLPFCVTAFMTPLSSWLLFTMLRRWNAKK